MEAQHLNLVSLSSREERWWKERGNLLMSDKRGFEPITNTSREIALDKFSHPSSFLGSLSLKQTKLSSLWNWKLPTERPQVDDGNMANAGSTCVTLTLYHIIHKCWVNIMLALSSICSNNQKIIPSSGKYQLCSQDCITFSAFSEITPGLLTPVCTDVSLHKLLQRVFMDTPKDPCLPEN